MITTLLAIFWFIAGTYEAYKGNNGLMLGCFIMMNTNFILWKLDELKEKI